MIGIIIVTHGRLAEEFVAAAEHVVGPLDQCAAICIGPDDDVEQRRDDIRDAVETVDGGNGVIILTDMFGGTPSNLAISLIDKGQVEVVAGVNLPMMIKLAEARGQTPLDDLAQMAAEAGRRYVAVASDVLDGAA
ncbi:PTS sugar transporter subunit IIA [Hyphobacterium marinum]|uniref:PTS sugar transporter subunit IIA n=1 Tax=Hyphobacterium marinum TaxID=3116574 RepID=A0ABU7LVJ3_9PROT|nr:PTS sugar transporter subunit IIA [Hyphobacterium sp. Y6023]MEE2565195.1 PTS sugar transporter subunit IIA [Hyphobacterium sp. Y6023]